MNGVKVRFLNRDEILPDLKSAARHLVASQRDVLEVSLFGSFVRGNYGPGSDADVFILLKRDRRKFIDRIPEFLGYFSRVEVPVEVFPYTVEEVARMEGTGFIRAIQKEKIVLEERGKD